MCIYVDVCAHLCANVGMCMCVWVGVYMYVYVGGATKVESWSTLILHLAEAAGQEAVPEGEWSVAWR